MIVTEVLLAVQAVEAVVDLVKKIDETVDEIQDDKPIEPINTQETTI